MNTSNRVRPAAVAGTFYPAQPDRLGKTVDEMLEAVAASDSGARPRILLAPHAGYIYSGQVAAHAYRRLGDPAPSVAIIVGPSHVEAFDYTSVFDGGYETPLGVVAIDRDIADHLTADGRAIRYSDAGHVQHHTRNQEHGLEVQLPFLQRVAPGIRIVPVIMGDQSWEQCHALGQRLVPLLDRHDVVVVVSSDLSHFYSYEDAREKDAVFCDLLDTLDATRLYEAIASRECEACGAGPMIAALIANQKRRSTCRLLHALNSGDVTGDHHSVVGYASAVIADDEGTGGAS